MDSDLQAIREARMKQLKEKNSGNNGSGNNNIDPILVKFLTNDAIERLNRVSLVRPERIDKITMYLKQMISTGQVRNKISDDDIVRILDGLAREENKSNNNKIIFNRRSDYDDDEMDITKKTIDEDDEDDFFD